MRGQERQHFGYTQPQGRFFLIGVVGLFEWVDPCHSGKALVVPTIVEGFHGCQLHGLMARDKIGGVVARERGKQCGYQSYDTTYLNALHCEFLLALAQEVPAAYTHCKHSTDNP